MTNKLVVIINSLKYQKLRKFYYMKWNEIPILCPQLNLLNPVQTKFLDTPLAWDKCMQKRLCTVSVQHLTSLTVCAVQSLAVACPVIYVQYICNTVYAPRDQTVVNHKWKTACVIWREHLPVLIGVMWGWKGPNNPPIFFLLQNNFFWTAELSNTK